MKQIIKNFTVILSPAEEREGGYLVSVPALPEICTEGDTEKEALKNAAEAILCVIESEKKLLSENFSQKINNRELKIRKIKLKIPELEALANA